MHRGVMRSTFLSAVDSIVAGCQVATATPTRAGWPELTPPICSYDAYNCSDFDSVDEANEIRALCAAQCKGDIAPMVFQAILPVFWARSCDSFAEQLR